MAYFVFSLFWYLSYKFFFNFNKKKSSINTFILSVVFGIIIEVLQEQLTNNRQADVFDVVANTFGTILAVFMLNLIFKDR